jgi:predicted Zn-dependent protease with MMP-like domain
MPDPEVALTEALQWVADEPDCADAHYDLALAYEALEREEERRREMLTVLSLDSRSGSGPLPDDVICDEVEMTLAELPPAIEERLGPVAILIEPRPSRELVKEGIDARILGLFEGATSEELSGPDAPLTTTRILVFSHNLGDAFAGEPEAKLRAEVRITVLHEVGHFFGLEEDDMERLGLE